jgi:hypothetical protein
MIEAQHIQRAHDFMTAIKSTCADRRLPMPDIREVLIVERRARVFAFAVFPQSVGHKQEAYAAAPFLHQISSTLQGVPVTFSNSTGFRLCALLDGPRELLPGRLDYPGHRAGYVRLGLDAAGREVTLTWEQFGHALIVGMTGSGKSSMLRVIAADALADGHRLIIGDLHDNTFPMLAGHGALLAPIVHTVPDYIERMKLIKAIADERRGAYVALHERKVYPDNLDEYNAAVEGAQRLPRIVAFFDEISTACDQDRGRNGELAHLAFQAATEVRKFGINLVFSGQSITADLIGPMRDQLSTRVCFRVARREISQLAVFRKGAELIEQPGRALTPSGLWQAYYLDKQPLIETAQAGQGGEVAGGALEAGSIDPSERVDQPEFLLGDLNLAKRCRVENDGRFTESWLISIGFSQRAARRVKAEWITNRWLVVDESTLGKPAVLAVQVCERLDLAYPDLSCTDTHDSARQAHD